MNLGNLLLVSALIISCVTLIFQLRGSRGGRVKAVTSRQLYYLASALIFFAFLFLLAAFLNDEFRYAYVYHNSSRDLPLAYKIAAVWAGKEGSFLLWLMFLNIMGIVISRTDRSFENILMPVVVVAEIFILMLLVGESPFRFLWDAYPEQFAGGKVLPQGLDGMGMNPLLMDPWMVVHPPILFLGYASATIPFGYAVAALLKNDYRSWLGLSYRWVLFSMATLGIGIFLGGYWAYKVLGWGGYWGWDPVENSSLIPWLVVVALMHGMIIQKRKGALVRTNIFLSMLYFILVFYSTFLTRSGVLSNFSVHSFGAEGISGYIIYFILFYVLVSAYLFITRLRRIPATAIGEESFWKWDSLTIYGALTLVIFSIIILVGTSMPIISGLFTKNPSPVTEHFYNNLSVPFGILILLLMVGATIAMKGEAFRKMITLILALASVLLSVLINLPFTRTPAAYVFVAISLFVIMQYISDFITIRKRAIITSRLAHMGVAIFILGAIASGYYSSAYQKKLTLGVEEKVGPVTLTFKGLSDEKKSMISFSVKDGSGTRSFSSPYFIDERTQALYREPYIETGFFGDIYITAENYVSGAETASMGLLGKDEERVVGDCTVVFKGFKTEGMMGGEPVTVADLLINGRRAAPGIKLKDGERIPIEARVPGTDRRVLLMGFDLGQKTVNVFIEPAKDKPVPADTVVVDVSVKRMIWLVWLGTVLVAVAGTWAMFRKS
jgi:cytochrome c-type biogenesis protein CcmF